MHNLIAWFHAIISPSTIIPTGDGCGYNPSSHLSSYPSRFFNIIHLISAPKYNLSPYITLTALSEVWGSTLIICNQVLNTIQP